MCRAKSGNGRRCARHTQSKADGAVVSLTAALAGHVRHERVREVMRDLEQQAADAPAPSRTDVDDWLSQQIDTATHLDTISDSRRLSIIDRLRAAIGRILPDGATFHAWRNAVNTFIGRNKIRFAAVTAAGALTLGALAGCGSSTDNVPSANNGPAGTRPAATAPATTTTTTAPAPVATSLPVSAYRPVGDFSAEQVKAATEGTVFPAVISAASNDDFVNGTARTTAEVIEPWSEYLSDDFRQQLLAQRDGVGARGFAVVPVVDGGSTVNGWASRPAIGHWTTSIDERTGNLCLDFDYDATLKTSDGNIPVSRHYSVNVMQSTAPEAGSPAWLITGFDVTGRK
jgi:hypothetical protein